MQYEEYRQSVQGVTPMHEDSAEFHRGYLQAGADEDIFVRDCANVLLMSHGACDARIGKTYTIPENVTIFFFAGEDLTVSPVTTCKFLRDANQKRLFTNTQYPFFFTGDRYVDDSILNINKLRHGFDIAAASVYTYPPTLKDLKKNFTTFVETNGAGLASQGGILQNKVARILPPGTTTYNYVFQLDVFNREGAAMYAPPSYGILDLPNSTPSNTPELKALIEAPQGPNNCIEEYVQKGKEEEYIAKFKQHLSNIKSPEARKVTEALEANAKLNINEDIYLSTVVKVLIDVYGTQKRINVFVNSCTNDKVMSDTRLFPPGEDLLFVAEGSREYNKIMATKAVAKNREKIAPKAANKLS